MTVGSSRGDLSHRGLSRTGGMGVGRCASDRVYPQTSTNPSLTHSLESLSVDLSRTLSPSTLVSDSPSPTLERLRSRNGWETPVGVGTPTQHHLHSRSPRLGLPSLTDDLHRSGARRTPTRSSHGPVYPSVSTGGMGPSTPARGTRPTRSPRVSGGRPPPGPTGTSPGGTSPS